MNSTKSLRLILILSIFALLLGSPLRVQAQVITGTLSGFIRDAATNNNITINMPVVISNLDGTFMDSVCTDTGEYAFMGLPLDKYIVEVGGNGVGCNSVYDYAREYWPNAPFINSASPVDLTINPTRIDINFTLDPGGTIAGRVLDTNLVVINGRVSIALNIEDYSFSTELYTCTDLQGYYSIKHVPLGFNYKVAANVFPCPNNAEGFASINAWPDSPTNSGGTTLTPTLAVPYLENKDFYLSRLGDTPSGNVVTTFTSTGFIRYDSVSGAGTTTVEPILSNPPPAPPNFQLVGEFYEVSTTATFTSAQVCFNYDATGMNVMEESAVRLLHKESLVWVDVTDPGYPNLNDDVVCGSVDGFSPFVVARALYNFSGFFQPVDMNGVYNLVKGGSTVPLKFEVFAGSTELTDIADIKSLTYSPRSCDTNAFTDDIEAITTGDTSLRYEGGQFIYNWKTPKLPGLCYRVTMTTIDNSTLIAYFKFK